MMSNDTPVNLLSFDASKYKQIRIAIKYKGEPILTGYAKTEIEKLAQELDSGLISKQVFDLRKKIILDTSSLESTELNAALIAKEGGTEFQITKIMADSLVIDSPPSNLNIIGYSKGEYSIAIWGE